MKRGLSILLSCAMLAGCLIISSCGHDTPQDYQSTNGGPSGGGATSPYPGNGHRPGIGELDNFDSELADDVLRIKGPGINLRYDRAGVLFVTERSAGVRVIDLDGAAEVRIITGGEEADSIMLNPVLTVNGRNVELAQMKKMRRHDGRIWYKVTDSAGDGWVIVIPD